ncbi:hypothetical protein ACJX0J_041693, partial [Zea mays]
DSARIGNTSNTSRAPP